MRAILFFLFLSFSTNNAFCQESIGEYLQRINSDEHARSTMNAVEIKTLKETMDEIFKIASGEVKDPELNFKSIYPKDLFAEHFSLFQGVAERGLTRPENIDYILAEYKKILNLKAPKGVDEKEFWKKEYDKILNKFLERAKVKKETCRVAPDQLGPQKCCQGFDKELIVESTSIACKVSQSSCSVSNECCSGFCRKDDPNKNGVCEPSYTCKKIYLKGQSCNEQFGFCLESECFEDSKKKGKFICVDCVGKGKKPVAKQVCCPGTYLGVNGICINDIEPLSMPQSSSYFYKVIIKLSDLIFASAYAAESEGLTQAQQDLLDKKMSSCNSNNAQGSKAHTTCLEEVASQRAAYIQDVSVSLTPDQNKILEDRKNACVSENESGTKKMDECLALVDKLNKDMIAENTGKGITGEGVTADEYIKKYGAPAITAKTYSNIKQCEFNSYNDNWRDASNLEKNAEVFLRAFEYVYSNEGTQDYWVDGNKGNIFSRAKKIANQFKEFRYTSIQEMQKIDTKMACKCMAIYGPSTFEDNKQKFFQESCDQERVELQKDLGTNGQKSNIDGSSIDGEKSEIAKDNAQIEETDKGATGISHEKLLIEWLSLRREAQLIRFTENAKLEEEADALSEYIAQIDFNEVYQDRLSGKSIAKASPPGDSLMVYSWGIKYYRGFIFAIMKIFGAKRDTKGRLSKAMASSLGNVSDGTKAGFIGAFKQKVPYVADATIYKKKKAGLLKYKDKYARYYIGPRFENKSKGTTKCLVYASAAACFRSFYKTKVDGNNHYLIDPTRPLFVGKDKVNIDGVANYGKTWVQLVNDARNNGIQYLKSRSGSRSDIMASAVRAKHFSVLRGKMVDPEMSSARRAAIIMGAKKYALCTSLQKCGAPNEKADALGFGYLFESSKEAMSFASYTYDLHYHWANISQNDILAYPKMGQDAYFKSLAYNLKLVGSLAKNRVGNLSEAIALYTNDLKNRASNYNSLGEAVAGRASSNVKFGERFFGEFNSLNFTGDTNIETYRGSKLENKSSSNLGEAELAALSAANKSALRNKLQQKRLEQFNKEKKAGRAGNNKSSLKNLRLINTPLDSIGVNKLNGGKAGINTANIAGVLSDQVKKSQASKGNNKAGSNQYAASNFNLPNSQNKNYNFSDGNYDVNIEDDSELNNGKVVDQEISPEQVDRIIDALGKVDKETTANESDSIFQIVTKAYKRNLSRVLKRASTLKAKNEIIIKKKSLDKDKKEELKKLLESS